MMNDLQETWMLLQVVKEAMGHPKLKPILDQAGRRLEEIAKGIEEGYEPTTADAPPEEIQNADPNDGPKDPNAKETGDERRA
jgi:hypothetical protein